MLKFYTMANTTPIVISGFDRTKYRYAINNSLRDGTSGERTQILRILKNGSGLKEFVAEATDGVIYPMFLDSDYNRTTKLAIAHNKINFSHLIRIAFYFVQDTGEKLLLYSQNILDPSEYSNTMYLTSAYSSNEDLASVDDEISYFIKQMVQTEKDILSDRSFWSNVVNIASSHFLAPFVVVIDNGVTVDFKWNGDGDVTPFLNAPSLYYMLTEKRFFTVNKFKNYKPDVMAYNPAFAYNPLEITFESINDYAYNYGVSAPQAVKTNIQPVTLEQAPEVKEVSQFNLLHVEIPSKLFPYWYNDVNRLTKNLGMSLPDGFYNSDFVGFKREDNSYSLNNKFKQSPSYLNKYFYIFTQIKDVANMSELCKETGNFRLPMVANDDKKRVPYFGIGRCDIAPYDFDIEMADSYVVTYQIYYGNDDLNGFGSQIGSEMLHYLYGDETEHNEVNNNYTIQPDGPQNPDDPESQPSGGFTGTTSVGGKGTWKANQDKTSIDYTKDPTTDKLAPLPPTGSPLSANVSILKMSSTAIKSLAAQTWQSGGWMSALKDYTGASSVGQGISDVKACFLDMNPLIQSYNLEQIAGHPLTTPIACSKMQQFYQFYIGKISVPKYFDSFLDYSPYTSFKLDLPFSTSIDLPPELVVGDIIEIGLRADIVNGYATYRIQNSQKIIADVPCNVFVNVPFTTSEYSVNRIDFILSEIAKVGGAMGVTHFSSEAATASATAVGLGALGNVPGVYDALHIPHTEDVGALTNRTYHQISSSSPSTIGAMGLRACVLRTTRPYVLIPNDYYNMNGAPSSAITQLANCTGYFEVSKFYGTLNCTSEEYAEVEALLSAGVYP